MNMQRAIGRAVEANGRSYRIPQTPTVVVCIDGSEIPGYVEAAPIEGGVYSTGGLVPALAYEQVVERLGPYLTTPWSMAGTAGITS